jgi:hypothetical protein
MHSVPHLGIDVAQFLVVVSVGFAWVFRQKSQLLPILHPILDHRRAIPRSSVREYDLMFPYSPTRFLKGLG